jgi:large subunit ribosomal protein L23
VLLRKQVGIEMGKIITKRNRKPAPERTLKLEPHQVVLKPIVTEKGMYQFTELNQYTFKVNPVATKTEIKAAIEKLFEVKVVGLSTMTRKGKSRRSRFKMGRTKDTKIANTT